MMTARIGLLTYGLDRPPTGIGRYTIGLLGALADLLPAPPVLLTPAEPRYLPNADRYPQRRLSLSRRLPALLVLGGLQLRACARDLDLLHDPSGNAPFLFAPPGCRLVVTIYDVFALAFPATSTRIEKVIARFWLPLVLPRVEAIITVSQHSRRDIQRYLSVRQEKIALAPPAVERHFRPLPAEQLTARLKRYGLAPGAYLLTVAGAQDPRRNLPRLLEAYALLKREGETRPLVVIGKPRRSAWEQHERFSLTKADEGVKYLGYVPEEDLPALYNGAVVFVFPSLYEGFGLPPLEAMACGAPVACSNAASLPEVVGEAALLFDPRDVNAMAAAIQRLLQEESLRAELRERGLERAAQFTWEQTARQTLEVYRRVCEG
jgi:glycosyltransferase involved in cell wall biosynthesis